VLLRPNATNGAIDRGAETARAPRSGALAPGPTARRRCTRWRASRSPGIFSTGMGPPARSGGGDHHVALPASSGGAQRGRAVPADGMRIPRPSTSVPSRSSRMAIVAAVGQPPIRGGTRAAYPLRRGAPARSEHLERQAVCLLLPTMTHSTVWVLRGSAGAAPSSGVEASSCAGSNFHGPGASSVDLRPCLVSSRRTPCAAQLAAFAWKRAGDQAIGPPDRRSEPVATILDRGRRPLSSRSTAGLDLVGRDDARAASSPAGRPLRLVTLTGEVGCPRARRAGCRRRRSRCAVRGERP
jgi:hypothetical protein